MPKKKPKSKGKPKAKPNSKPASKAKGKSKAKSKPKKAKPRRPGQQGRPPAGTADWIPTFLKAITDGLHVRDACQTAGIDGTLPYARRVDDEEFKRAWAEASKIGTKMLEAEANRRAFHGTLKPVYHRGEEVGQIREYSDTLIMFLLRGRKPAKYRDNSKVEHVGKDGAALPGVNIYLPDNGRSKPDDASDDGSQAEKAEAAADGSGSG